MDTWTIVGVVVTSIALLFTIVAYLVSSLDRKIEEKVADPSFVRRIAAEVRLPFVIFDENGTILSDVGGYQLLESLRVMRNQKGTIIEIQVTPRTFLPVGPILESIGGEVSFQEPTRARSIDWHFKVDPRPGTLLLEGGKDPVKKLRLTIIK